MTPFATLTARSPASIADTVRFFLILDTLQRRGRADAADDTAGCQIRQPLAGHSSQHHREPRRISGTSRGTMSSSWFSVASSHWEVETWFLSDPTNLSRVESDVYGVDRVFLLTFLSTAIAFSTNSVKYTGCFGNFVTEPEVSSLFLKTWTNFVNESYSEGYPWCDSNDDLFVDNYFRWNDMFLSLYVFLAS